MPPPGMWATLYLLHLGTAWVGEVKALKLQGSCPPSLEDQLCSWHGLL